jgi:hypothetical protein
LDRENRDRLQVWKNFHRELEKIDFEILDLANGRSRSAVLKDLTALSSSLNEDPFLRSCFFEKLAFNYSWEKTFHPEDLTTNWGVYGRLFEQCMSKGVQDAELYEKFGKLLVMEGKWDEAQAAFQKALKFYPGNPWLIHERDQARIHGPVD